MPVFEEGGVVRDLSLILDAGVIFYSTLFAIFLLGRWLKDTRRSLFDIRLAWAVFFVGMIFNTSSFILGDFYFTAPGVKVLYTKAGYLALTFALVAFFLAIEHIMPYSTYHAFSLSGVVITLLTIISPTEYLELLALTISIITFIGIILFFAYSRGNTSGDVKSSVNVLITGFIVGFFGFLGRSEFTYLNLGEAVYLIGAFLLVGGLAIFGIALVRSPALDELDWKKQIVRLYVIQDGGILVYFHEFAETDQKDEVLTAAGISGIQSLMKEITRSETGLNMLSIGTNEVLFAHGLTFSCVLIAKRPYSVLLDKVREFTNEFQSIYGRVLQHFDGDMSLFRSAHWIVEAVF